MDREDGFLDFTFPGTLRGEEGVFDELLGDGGGALQGQITVNIVHCTFKVIVNVLIGGAGDVEWVDAGVFVEVLVFDGDMSVDDMGRELVYLDRGAVVILVKLVQQDSVSVQDFGGGW